MLLPLQSLSMRVARVVLLSAASLLCLPYAIADDANPSAVSVAGRQLFTKTAAPSCAICHTLKDAGSEGAIGPNLDELKPDGERVAKALRNGLGQMPPFKASLSEEQIIALTRYVAQASGGDK